MQKGTEIDLRDCTFGPGETHWGGSSGQYMVDLNAFYAIVFLPTDFPGGHFRFRGVYPRARWFSYESYDEGLASEGVVDDTGIYPDQGSTSPFLAPNHYVPGHDRYTVDIYSTPPAQRTSPPPPNVLYMGYRENPSYGGLEHSPYSPVLYRIYVPAGTPQGRVPLPHLFWVVDDPNTNPFQTDTEVCNAMEPARAPNQSILEINDVLNQRVSEPTLQPAERNIDIPTDEAPYLSWCAAQFVSPVNVTQACLMDKQFHIDGNGFATMVVSPPDERPRIGGKPYADWLPWPGGGADLNMRRPTRSSTTPAAFRQPCSRRPPAQHRR